MPSERYTGLSAVLDAIRGDEGITQPVLVERVGLGRSMVAQRVAELEQAGLIASDGLGPSTGGRAPRRLRLRAEAGFVLGVDVADNELVVGVADLAGSIIATRQEHTDVRSGPEAILSLAEQLSNELLADADAGGRLRAVALGLPEPIVVDSGSPAASPTMRDWERYPTREHLSASWGVPVWMDDRVNLLALGERRSNPVAGRSAHMLYVGGGASIGAAVVLDGHLYRGARGLAGSIGHVRVSDAADAVCRCGNVGCLVAVVGGGALTRDARLFAETGQSAALAEVLAEKGAIRPIDITQAANAGDAAARALLERAGSLIGDVLAMLVNAYDPELVVIGGGIARARGHVLDAARRAVNRHALPAVTRGLRIELSAVDEEIAGVIGAVQFALDQAFSPDLLPSLLDAASSPHGSHQGKDRARSGLSA